MKKLTALILTLSMLLSMFVLPMGASAAEITEAERQEILNAKTYDYLDITKIDNAYVREAYGYIDQNAYNKGLKAGLVFDRKDTDPTFSRLKNTNFWTKMAALDTFNPALYLSNLAVKYYDITTGVDSGALTLHETTKVTGTVGVADETTGIYSLQPAEYNVSTYLLDGVNAKYKVGPVAEPNKDAEGNWGDDVYSTTGSQVIIGAIDKNGDGASTTKNYTYYPENHQVITLANETQSYATLSNINKSADYVNLLHATLAFNESSANATVIPVTVNYTEGDPTVKYVIDTLYSVDDPMSVVLAVKNNEDKSAHTATQLDEAYTNKNYLTTAVTLDTLGLTGVSLNDAKFESDDVIAATKTERIGTAYNRNIGITYPSTDEDGDGVYTTTVSGTRHNTGTYKFVPSDFSVPVDSARTISSVQIAASYTATSDFIADNGMIKAESGTYYYYLPVSFDAYSGDEYSFYIRITRHIQRKSALFAMTLTNKSLQEKIDAINTEIEAAETIEELAAAKAAIAELVAENEAVLESDFKSISAKATELMNKEIAAAKTLKEYEKVDEDLDVCAEMLGMDVSALKATVAAKIADLERVAGLDNRYFNIDMEFYHDFFATDNDLKDSKWAVTSTAEAPNIFGYKGFSSGMTQTFPTTYKYAFMTSKIADAAAMSEKNGTYTFTIGNVPYKMGKISTEDGVLGANAWVPRSKHTLTAFDDASKLNPVNANVFSTGCDSATYTINKSGISDINLMSATLGGNSTRFNKVYVKYEGESEKLYYHIIGRNNSDFADKIMIWPVEDYNKLMADETKTVDMVDHTIGGWERGKADETYLALRDATKYYAYKNDRENYSTPVAMNTLTTVDLSKVSDNNADEEIYFPQASAQFVDSNYGTGKSYAHTVAIPTDPAKKIETIRINSDLGNPDTISVASGGFYQRGTYSVAEAMLRVKYDGKDTITLDGTEYVVLVDVTRECTESAFFGMTLTNAKTLAEEIAELNAELDAVDPETITVEEIAEFKEKIAKIKAKSENVLDSDFNTEKLKLAEGKHIDTLKLKANFPMSEKNGANAKLFIDYATYQTYDNANSFTGEWVKGLDYTGIVNYNYDADGTKDHTSYPTGTATDKLGVNGKGYELSNALVYKVDQTAATASKWGITYVNLTTKNNVKTWTVNGTEFAIDTDEKIVKVYTPTDASGVEDADLRERFATLNNPVFDIENGCYESIDLLTAVSGNKVLTPTIIYEDGTTKTLSGKTITKPAYAEGTNDHQDAGYMLLQTVINWDNNSDGGTYQFVPVEITGFDTTKKIDKISFKSNAWGAPILVVSAFGTTATVSEILTAADASDFASAEYAVNTVDAILAENGYTADDLSATSLAKYNDLKTAGSVLSINEITLEDNVLTVNYSYDGASAKAAIILVVEYKDDEESEFVSVKKYPVSFTKDETELTTNVETTAGNKVKVLVWKNLTDFFPLTANIYSK